MAGKGEREDANHLKESDFTSQASSHSLKKGGQVFQGKGTL